MYQTSIGASTIIRSDCDDIRLEELAALDYAVLAGVFGRLQVQNTVS
jgi:hypothetical protein